MSRSIYSSRVVKLGRPATLLYSTFTDLTLFAQNIPSEILTQATVEATPNTIRAKVKGIELGVEVVERTPFSQIKMQQYGATPIKFDFFVNLESIDANSTNLQLILKADLPSFYKMMVGGKITDALNQLADKLEESLGV